MRLDHTVLEVERVVLSIDHDVLQVVDLAHQVGRTPRLVLLGEIARNSALQVLRLTHIDNRSLGVVVTIDAGGIGHDIDNAHQVFVTRIVFSLDHNGKNIVPRGTIRLRKRWGNRNRDRQASACAP